jgi:hypothetical protein
MPAGAVGTVWAAETWLETVYVAGAWADSNALTPHAEVIVRVRGHNAVNPDSDYDILDGGLWVKDPGDQIFICFDWDAVQLAHGVTVADFTLSVEALEGDDGSPSAALMATEEDLLTGSRKMQARFSAGTLGALYRVDCSVTTSEGQIKERSIYIRIEER